MFKLNYKKLIILISFIITLIFLLTSCSFLESQESSSSPIIIYGDSRTDHQTHQKIVNEIIKIKPSIVFHTGDLVEDGLNPAQWATFNEIISDLVKIAEFYPALGNHENNSPLYFDNFDLPNNERWYIVEKNNLHFIILDSNSDCSIDSEQYLWLEDDLQNINENIKFVIAIFHHPPFSTGPHTEDEKGLRQSIVPLFEQHGIDLVFNGHDHDYERSSYNDIYYIVTGGGGAPLRDQARTSPYSQLFIKTYHFCKLSLIDNKLIIEVNGILDELQFKENSSNIFEEWLKNIARYLGFDSQRPEQEYKKGPDVMWKIGELRYLVIECKNGATATTISKDYCNQLNGSCNWFEGKYDNTCSYVPIMVHPSTLFEYAASPKPSIRIITKEKLNEFCTSVRDFIKSVASNNELGNQAAIRQKLIAYKLRAVDFSDIYTVPYKVKN